MPQKPGPKSNKNEASGNPPQMETPPKDITMADLWILMMSIKKDTEAANSKLSQMDKRVGVVEDTNKEVEGKLLDIEANITSLQSTVGLLSGRMIRSETKNVRLQRELSELKTHSMKNNLIFNFDYKSDVGKEQRDENCVDIVRKFMRDVLKVPSANKLSIAVAHRLGSANGKGHKPIIARFPVAADVDLIMSNVRTLKGTRHFINRQLPPDKRERKQFAMSEFSEKRKVPNAKVRMVNENVYVNGDLQRKFLLPTLPSGLDQHPDESDHVAVITESDPIEDHGSTFKGYVADVASLVDVRGTLDSLIRRPDVAAATHVIYAYRFHVDDNPENVMVENFDSDGDYGVGLKLLRAMQDKEVVSRLFVATRTCASDFAHIGQRRFQHAIDACFSVLCD
jgi:hypothetical protein